MFQRVSHLYESILASKQLAPVEMKNKKNEKLQIFRNSFIMRFIFIILPTYINNSQNPFAIINYLLVF